MNRLRCSIPAAELRGLIACRSVRLASLALRRCRAGSSQRWAFGPPNPTTQGADDMSRFWRFTNRRFVVAGFTVAIILGLATPAAARSTGHYSISATGGATFSLLN